MRTIPQLTPYSPNCHTMPMGELRISTDSIYGDVDGQELDILNENLSWVSGAPRKATVAHFRPLKWHDCLRSHLGIADSPDCTLGDSGQPMTTEHLVVCHALINLNSIVEKYWRARALMP
ncbi:hypothetical protein TNCV_766931 [Trichonephila clavipes]|nr:hypothetical protein TNCV_766931 [Trichonephila clavipes]